MFYNFNNLKNLNFEKIIKSGKVVYLEYIIIKEDEIKKFKFIGICLAKRNKYKTIFLRNLIKREHIDFLFHLNSPSIIKIKILKKYKKKYRLSKLYKK